MYLTFTLVNLTSFFLTLISNESLNYSCRSISTVYDIILFQNDDQQLHLRFSNDKFINIHSWSVILFLYTRGGGCFKKFEEKCCQICNCHGKFSFSVHVVN